MICCGQEMARKSPRDTAVRLVTAKRGQKEAPRLGSTICYGLELARKRHRDSAVRFVAVKSWPEEPPRLGNTICYAVTAKSWPEAATKTRQYDLLQPRVGQKEPPRLHSTICYGQEWARKSHRNSAVRVFYGQELARKQDSAVRFATGKRGPERATKTRQYDLLRPRVGQKPFARLGSTICYGQELARKSLRDSAVRFVTAKRGPRESAVRFVTANRGPEGATETRQYDLLRPNVGQKEPPRLGSTICYGQMWASKSHQDSAARFVAVKRGPERATKTRQYDLLRPRLGQKEPPRLGSTICYGQTWARKSHRDSAARFVTTKSWPERVTETRQYDLLRPNMGQKEPPRLGSTVCYGQELATKTRQYGFCGLKWARKSYRDSAVRCVSAKRGPERATESR